MKDRLKNRSAAFWGNTAILGLTFLAMTVLNTLTPLVSDDYTYSRQFPGGEPITGLGDIFTSLAYNYQYWSGRMLGLGLTFLFCWLPKMLFNLFNAALFCWVAWGICKLISGRKAVTPPLLLAVVAALVHLNPCFGAVNLWLCGSCVYLAPLACCVGLLVPYRLALDSPVTMNKAAMAGYFLLAVLAGWGNENTSGAALLAAVLLCLWLKITQKKLPLWAILGAVGTLLGFIGLMAAPGQWARMDSVNVSQSDPRSPLTIFLIRVMNATHSLRAYGFWLVLAFGALFALCWLAGAGWQRLVLCGFWGIMALAANYALVLCPVYYVRSFYPVLMFLLVGIGACLDALGDLKERNRLALGLICGALCAVLCFDLLEGGYDILSYYTMRSVREQDIKAQIAAGQTNVETYAVYPYTRFCGAWGMPDLRLDPNNWVNVNAARVLGADSITVTEQHYYPFPGYDDFTPTVEQEMSLELE